MRYIFLLAIFLGFTTKMSVSASLQTEADYLRCEQLVDPNAIDNLRPSLSWRMNSTQRGKSQSAYRVIVSTSIKELNRDKGDYWDSGKVNLADSVMVQYSGLPLESRTQVFWKVMIWDEKGKPTPWSRPSSWTMGLLQANDWKAKWIGATEDSAPDEAKTGPAPYFRKEFESAKTLKKATAYICGLGFYELSINGKKLGDQVLAPAVTNYDKRPLKDLLYPYDDQSTQRVFYNVFDVSKELTRGPNCIGVLLGNGWYNQRDRTVEGKMWYDLPKLIFQLEITYSDGSIQQIVSDGSWKTSTGPLLHDGIFTGEKYDARLELGSWQKASYKDDKWKPALLVRKPTGRLEMQTAPFDKVVRTLRPVLEEKKDMVSRFKLEETVSGWASLRVKGKLGSQIKIRYISEEGEDYGQTDTYILKGEGAETWKPRFTWHTFRRMEIAVSDASVDLESIVVEDVHTAVAANGTFECSNPFFNKINTAYIKTQRANFHGSVSSDCPHRERLGYTGDGQVAMESALDSFDMFRFYRKWFLDMDDARNKKTGFVTHTAPFGGGGGGPAWGSAYVIMPWLHYVRYGDKATLEQHYGGMKQWIDYLKTRTDENGLVVREEPNGWCLGDWCTPTPTEIPEPLVNTAYFYHVTDLMAKISRDLGKKDDQARFLKLATEIKSNFNKAYFDASKNSYWEGRQGSDVLPLAFGLVPDDKRDLVFNSLLEKLRKLNYHFDTGILATPLLLKVLSDAGRDDIAYKLMDQRDFPSFGYLLDDKNSTLWEAWDTGGSHCHPMFGSVVNWFYAGLGGIKTEPNSPGMRHFIIEPKTVADLEYCKSSYNSLYGAIRSEWKKMPSGKHQFIIEVPTNASATFVLPDKKLKAIDENGKDIPVRKLHGKSEIEFKSGVYKFEA
jgi:alpha-L-rhamnosidase